MLLQVYDPEYYIALAMPSAEAVRLVDAPAGCRLRVTPARGPDAAAAAALAEIGPDQRELPAELQDLTGGIDNSAAVNCGGPTIAAADAQAAPQSAGEAAAMLAEGFPVRGDLTALSAVPQTSQEGASADAGTAEAGSAEALAAASGLDATPAAAGGAMAKIAALQARFNRDLTAALKTLKGDGSAFWWLGSISFLYGIVHAAGPG